MLRSREAKAGNRRGLELTDQECDYVLELPLFTQNLEEAGDSPYQDTLLQAIRHGAVVCWPYINLLGEYDCSDERLPDSVGTTPPTLVA